MQAIQGASFETLARALDVEVRGSEVYLFVHPPGAESGSRIVIPLAELREAVRPRRIQIMGKAPQGADAKTCEVTLIPEHVALEIKTSATQWWITVRRQDLEAALGQA
jgi:hypothetical protein